MLEITMINFDKNYFTINVSEKGDYLINGVVIEAGVGTYQIHTTYDFIRVLESGTIVKAQVAAGKEKPVVEKKKKRKSIIL